MGVHGIFADFTSFYIAGQSEIYNLQSDTGLVYGIGAYTSSQVELLDEFTMHHLHAGAGLVDVDTEKLSHPYHPSVAKPFHIIHQWVQYENTFHSAIHHDDAEISLSCILGRDGVENDMEHAIL